ncbi:MAG: hypothetical protein GY859_06695, partial [Desulfobacterales bacterium]|nr:hypothetical protein [Desulfobacterales bacterium]
MGTEIEISVDDAPKIKIHTSCSQPIGPGLVRGDLEVIEAYSLKGGKVCPLPECMECDGKITQLTLRYHGVNAGRVEVKQKKGHKDHIVIFDEMVDPGAMFTFNGTERDGTMGTEIEISVDGGPPVKLHTSCSRPIGPGLIIGDFEVIEGYSLKGGKLCPLPECMECDGKVTRLTLLYRGASDGQVVVTQKKGHENHVVVFDRMVHPGAMFSFNGIENNGTMGKEIEIFVDGALNTKIHTSCSRPIGPGMITGDFEIIEAYSLQGGEICPLDCVECDGKVTRLSLMFRSDAAGRIVVNQKKDHLVIFDEIVDPNDVFTFDGTEKDGTMGPEIEISVDGGPATKIHTSCSKPIGPGLVVGNFAVIEAYSLKGGAVCPVGGLDLSLPAVEIAPNPAIIMRGDSSLLTWTSENAITASLDNGVGDVALDGSLVVSPSETTTYTITAVGQDGSASASATVIVLDAASISVELTADPETILLGETSILTWDSTNAVSASLDQGVGDVSLDGSLPVSPEETTTYTITARGPGGEASASVTVTVIPPPTAALNADPAEIIQGKSTTLSWISTNADSASIDQGVGSVAANGSIVISPAETTTYTITAQGPGGTAVSTTTVVVHPIPAVSITALPILIAKGETSVLSWTSTNADSAVIDNGVGPVTVNGSMTVSPDESTTYTITASGPGGSATDSATVEVIEGCHYTFDADFDGGVLENVEHETVHDQLQLDAGVDILPFIWVANSAEGNVSKINTLTGDELGRYRTGPTTGTNPSRTTVDSDGNLWVGNRNTDSAVKIALTPRDKNGDGVITTSTGADDILPWGADEAIEIYITGVDRGPRALAIDADNNVWIGGYGKNMGYYDGETGAKLKNIFINRSCYGALVDRNGTLWVSSKSSGLTRINNPAGAHTISYLPIGFVYGIGIDADGYIYASAYEQRRLRKVDPDTNSVVFDYYYRNGYRGRGVAVGFDGDVWVANSSYSKVTRHNPSNGKIKATINVRAYPTGVAVDSAGKIWVTNLSGDSIQRIDPATEQIDFTQLGHDGPYNYSDMTGFISRNITTRNGRWTVVCDTYREDAPWGVISWNSSEPTGSGIEVHARTSNDQISWTDWEEAESGAPLTDLADGRYIEVEAAFSIRTGEVSPILYDLTVFPAANPRANTAPSFTSTPVIEAEEGVSYTYQATAADNENDALTYSLDYAPDGMAVDSFTGLVTWIPDALQSGDHAVTIRV